VSAERGKPRRGAKAGDFTLRARQDGAPIVVRVDAYAADLLGVNLGWLHAAVIDAIRAGRLQKWGHHADGRPVFRLRELAALLEEEVLAGG